MVPTCRYCVNIDYQIPFSDQFPHIPNLVTAASTLEMESNRENSSEVCFTSNHSALSLLLSLSYSSDIF